MVFQPSFKPFWLLLLAGIILFSACRTAQQYVESGRYDDAISYTVGKLQGKKKKKTKFVKALELAYQKAHARDLAAVDALIYENRPENWERINAIHRNIRERQQLVAPLTPLTSKDGYRARFDFVDIDKLESDSRKKAAEFLYARAEKLIAEGERGDRSAARDAYYSLESIERNYFKEYKDIGNLKRRARELGTSYVLFEVDNRSGKVLPREFADRLLSIGKNELDSEWKSFFFKQEPGATYDYKAVFNIDRIDISPERVNERQYIDEKEIQDGWDYVLDERGNVKKDTAGNDIKTPRYVRIRANVIEVFQSKAARITGYVEIFDLYSKSKLATETLGTEVLFQHYASTFSGDRRALSQESLGRIGNRPLPFPGDQEMLTQAAERLKPDLRYTLQKSEAIY